MWHELSGRVQRVSGTDGTPTIPKGAAIVGLQALPASGGGTIIMPDGANGTITITLADGSNGFTYDPKHTNATTTADDQIVFANTASFVVEFMIPTSVSVV